MTQRRFKGVVRQTLFLLPSFARRRSSLPPQPLPVPFEREETIPFDTLQILWANLLARLSHMAHRCAQADMIEQLKAFGVRRTGTVALSLGREYDRAWHEATAHGFTSSRRDVQQHARQLCSRQPPDEDFQALADAYRQLLSAIQDAPLRRWLSGRADVHAAQAKTMRQAAWRSTPSSGAKRN